jgi:hypothetical protein
MNSGRKESAHIRKSVWYVNPNIPDALCQKIPNLVRSGAGQGEA